MAYRGWPRRIRTASSLVIDTNVIMLGATGLYALLSSAAARYVELSSRNRADGTSAFEQALRKALAKDEATFALVNCSDRGRHGKPCYVPPGIKVEVVRVYNEAPDSIAGQLAPLVLVFADEGNYGAIDRNELATAYASLYESWKRLSDREKTHLLRLIKEIMPVITVRTPELGYVLAACWLGQEVSKQERGNTGHRKPKVCGEFSKADVELLGLAMQLAESERTILVTGDRYVAAAGQALPGLETLYIYHDTGQPRAPGADRLRSMLRSGALSKAGSTVTATIEIWSSLLEGSEYDPGAREPIVTVKTSIVRTHRGVLKALVPAAPR